MDLEILDLSIVINLIVGEHEQLHSGDMGSESGSGDPGSESGYGDLVSESGSGDAGSESDSGDAGSESGSESDSGLLEFNVSLSQ